MSYIKKEELIKKCERNLQSIEIVDHIDQYILLMKITIVITTSLINSQ